MQKSGGPFTHELTKASKEAVEKRIKKALKESGLEQRKEELLQQINVTKIELQGAEDKQTREILRSQLDEFVETYKTVRRQVLDVRRMLIDNSLVLSAVGAIIIQMITTRHSGCFPGSAMFTDKRGRQRNMSSMLIDDEVQVIDNNEIRFEPVTTFIHRQPEVMQEFLQIITEKSNILKITEDHLLFVEKTAPFWSMMCTPRVTLMCCLMSGPREPWVLFAPCIMCPLGFCSASVALDRRMDSQAGAD